MPDKMLVPFSARNRGAHSQVDNDFPETARMGVYYLLKRLVEMRYIDGWKAATAELQRISRSDPENESTLGILLTIPWDKALDFCERLYSHLSQDVIRHNFDDYEILTPKSQVQDYIAKELQLVFLEENLAFEFSDGLVRRRGRRNAAERVARAELVLGDPRLSAALTHFNKALRYFRSVAQLDPENVAKEAVCAVEATARVLFPDGGSTLGDIIKSITGNDPGRLPKALAQTFHGLYGFRNGGQGVGHGGTTGGAATKEIAEYALAVAASQIVLLVDMAAASEADIPF